MSNPEELNLSQESGNELLESSSNRLEELRDTPEKNEKLSQKDIESKIEKARSEALENASSGEKRLAKPEKKSSPSRRSTISKKELNASYRKTIVQMQSSLSTGNKIFSKIIHNNTVEKTSEIIGNTVARPNSILMGAIFAFILTLATYISAKTTGYALSGSETIIAFIMGWLLGIIIDYIKILFTGKNN